MIERDISYIVVALAPEDIVEKYRIGKEKFGLLLDESDKKSSEIILLNVPHLTLKYPFFIDPKDEERLIRALKKVKGEAFSLVVNNAEVFHPKKYGNVLVARPGDDPRLQKLHEDIYSIARPFGEDRDVVTFEEERFTPHLSFLYSVPDRDLVQAQAYLEQEILPFEFKLTEFYLLKTVNKEKGIRTIVSIYSAI